jgi:hypothetical protein
MRHALAFLAVALLAAGCPKKPGEAPNPPVENPSYRDAGGQTAAPDTGSGARVADGAPTPDSGTQAQGGDRAKVESCVDRWLQENKMDTFGHPEGTMYAGGSPLFNEATGESKDRLEYVFSRNPKARDACAPKPAR